MSEIRPKTTLEAIEQLQTFFQADLMYAIKNEKDLQKYLNKHFDICKKQIDELSDGKIRVKLNDFGRVLRFQFKDEIHIVKLEGDTYYEFENKSGKFPKINFEVV